MTEWEHTAFTAMLRGVPVVGLVYLFLVRKRSPRAVRIAMLAVILLFLTSGAALNPHDVWLRMQAAGLDKQTAWIALRVFIWVYQLAHTAGIGLLIWSVAVDRRPAGDSGDSPSPT